VLPTTVCLPRCSHLVFCSKGSWTAAGWQDPLRFCHACSALQDPAPRRRRQPSAESARQLAAKAPRQPATEGPAQPAAQLWQPSKGTCCGKLSLRPVWRYQRWRAGQPACPGLRGSGWAEGRRGGQGWRRQQQRRWRSSCEPVQG
jgi:hypothetical protein